MYALHLDARQIAIRVLLRVDFHVARAAVDRDLDLIITFQKLNLPCWSGEFVDGERDEEDH